MALRAVIFASSDAFYQPTTHTEFTVSDLANLDTCVDLAKHKYSSLPSHWLSESHVRVACLDNRGVILASYAIVGSKNKPEARALTSTYPGYPMQLP